MQTSLGTVSYVPDKDCLLWKIKQFYGMREYHMRAHFGLPSVQRDDGVGVQREAESSNRMITRCDPSR